MTKKKFDAVLTILIPSVIKLIMEHRGLDVIEATKLFYTSDVYAMLENEESKLWHLSALTLYSLFDEEIVTGTVNYPEEA
jgi:hypothetical protein